MLILTRNKGERIVIEYPNGDKIVIEFRKVRPSKLIIGTDAPDNLPVLRYELFAQSKTN